MGFDFDKQVGVTREDIANEEIRYESQSIELNKVGEHTVKLIGGLKRYVQRWIPVMRFDATTNNFEPSWTVITGDCPELDRLEKVDEAQRRIVFSEMAKAEGTVLTDAVLKQRARSRLAANPKYALLAFDLKEEKPTVKKVLLPWSLWKAIKELEEKQSTLRPGMLRYGPMYAWTCILEHKYDDDAKLQEMFRHSYKVTPYDTPFKDEISSIYLKQRPDAALRAKCFTPEQLEALEKCDIDLEAETKLKTKDDLQTIFAETPLNLGMMEKDGRFPIFVNPGALAPLLLEASIPFELPAGNANQRVLSEAPVSQAPTQARTLSSAPVVPAAPVLTTTPASIAVGSSSTKAEDIPPWEGGEEAKVEGVIPPQAATAEGNNDLGWDSDEQMMVVINHFVPTSKIEERLFNSWKINNGTRASFEQNFPGRIALLTGEAPSQTVPVTPSAPVASAPVSSAPKETKSKSKVAAPTEQW